MDLIFRAHPLVGRMLFATVFAVALAFLGVNMSVRLNAQEPTLQRAQPGDVPSANAILGAPLPEVRADIAGLRRTGVGIGPVAADGRRSVHVSYGLGKSNLVLLTVTRGSITAEGEPMQLPDAVASVVTKPLANGTLDVRYVWMSDGLAYVLHVNVSAELTRQQADAIAASVR